MTKQAKFMWNNFAAQPETTKTFSSQASGYPFTNVVDPLRSRVWRTAGNFTITNANNKIYINDGADKTVTLTNGNYTPTTLASHIQTQLNAASTVWTVSYSAVTFKFTISRASSATLRLSQTTGSAWSSIGFVGALDDNSGPWVSDEIRIHTDEWCDFDFGINVDLSFFGLVGKSNAMFSPSSSATMTLMLNNLPNAWDTPAKTITLTRTDEGVFHVFDLESYRYARFKIVDATNPNGFLEFSYCYLGDHTTFTKTNVQNGFSKTVVDPSVVSYADSGVPYFRKKTKYKRMDNVTVAFSNTSERTEFELFWNECGLTSPFFVVFDPELCVTSSINDLSGLFFFDGDPVFNHNFSQYFDIAFNLREAL